MSDHLSLCKEWPQLLGHVTNAEILATTANIMHTIQVSKIVQMLVCLIHQFNQLLTILRELAVNTEQQYLFNSCNGNHGISDGPSS